MVLTLMIYVLVHYYRAKSHHLADRHAILFLSTAGSNTHHMDLRKVSLARSLLLDRPRKDRFHPTEYLSIVHLALQLPAEKASRSVRLLNPPRRDPHL